MQRRIHTGLPSLSSARTLPYVADGPRIDAQALAAIGPFFEVIVHWADPGPPWRPMSELVSDATTLDRRIDQVRQALAHSSGDAPESVELRVAVSVAQLGLVARLVAPLLGIVVLGGGDPRPTPARTFWQPELGGPFPLSVADDVMLRPASGTTGGSLRPVIDGPLSAITVAAATRSALSPHVLWGNVASAVAGAGRLIAQTRPDLAARSTAIVAEALDHHRLRGEQRTTAHGFRRRSCCLIYRISPTPEKSLCGDCALAQDRG